MDQLEPSFLRAQSLGGVRERLRIAVDPNHAPRAGVEQRRRVAAKPERAVHVHPVRPWRQCGHDLGQQDRLVPRVRSRAPRAPGRRHR
jgi:hypothetical protein